MTKEVTATEINELLDNGMTKKEAGVELGISAQKVGAILAKSDVTKFKEAPLEVEILDGTSPSEFTMTYGNEGISENEGIHIFTAQEYADYSAANGRFEGRRKGQKTIPTIEDLRSLINAQKKPKYVMDKFGINAEEFKQLVWKLSKAELRGRPLKFDISQDYIEVG